MNYEVKTDTLDAAFVGAAIPRVAIDRPALSGARSIDPARAAFVDGYVRRGTDVELKSVSGATGPEGGYAVPREIDGSIDALLKSISPIRQIANEVRVGSAGYRKLVTQNGVASGWAAEWVNSVGSRMPAAAPVPSPPARTAAGGRRRSPGAR